MRISAAFAVAFAALLSTVHSHPATDLEARAAPANSEPFDAVGKRQVSVGASVTVVVVLAASLDQIRLHTGAINDTLATIDGDSTWVIKNNAMMTIRSELNAIGTILAAATTQVGTLGGNLGADLAGVANATLAIVNELLYTLQYAVNKLGSGVLVVLGIIINNVMSILAGLLLAVNILAHGTLSVTNASLNAGTANVNPAIFSIIQGLKYLIGY